jgi:hypothetical protein
MTPNNLKLLSQMPDFSFFDCADAQQIFGPSVCEPVFAATCPKKPKARNTNCAAHRVTAGLIIAVKSITESLTAASMVLRHRFGRIRRGKTFLTAALMAGASPQLM